MSIKYIQWRLHFSPKYVTRVISLFPVSSDRFFVNYFDFFQWLFFLGKLAYFTRGGKGKQPFNNYSWFSTVTKLKFPLKKTLLFSLNLAECFCIALILKLRPMKDALIPSEKFRFLVNEKNNANKKWKWSLSMNCACQRRPWIRKSQAGQNDDHKWERNTLFSSS